MSNFYMSNIEQLASLLHLKDDSSEDEDYNSKMQETKDYRTIMFDSIPKSNSTEQNYKSKFYDKCQSSKNIWSDDEIFDEDFEETGMKERPEYELLFQQEVTPNDIFLQMDGKGPGTNSCENIIVKIKLDDIYLKNEIDLKVTNLSLICKTKKHHLDLSLPREVIPEKGSAKWDDSTHILEVKLVFNEKKCT